MNPLITVGGAFLVLIVAFTALVLVARAAKWKPKPIKPLLVVLSIFAAVLVAGLVCSFFAQDIRVLYWWLAGIPIAAVAFPVCFVIGNIFSRLFIWLLLLMLSPVVVFLDKRRQRKKDHAV